MRRGSSSGSTRGTRSSPAINATSRRRRGRGADIHFLRAAGDRVHPITGGRTEGPLGRAASDRVCGGVCFGGRKAVVSRRAISRRNTPTLPIYKHLRKSGPTVCRTR
jgi:hypothetical protein